MGDCAKPSSVVEAEYKVGNGILGVEFLDLVIGYASSLGASIKGIVRKVIGEPNISFSFCW